ncbi:nitroreductase family protein [Ruegeria sp. R13_0]|uniref:nitroreductase family protein n=1 Tax=Ruegeria sp. R13_0 TaxID=2821099 RepID=UPI001ADBBDFC|nr:nitroreductase family protein [Ruegeria sp. R13_0]MBO9436999.1 nitroreductase family protein [Ruegeria sp. R13_0]
MADLDKASGSEGVATFGNEQDGDISSIAAFRYGEALELDAEVMAHGGLRAMLARGSCRAFEPQPVSTSLCMALCAVALAAPTKSDLQLRDIVLLRDETAKARLLELIGSEVWVKDAPNIALICGNHRRQRLLHKIQGHTFANDHLDSFFNATVDAAIALSTFVAAAESMGLGCCPVSAVRNEAAAVSDLLALPDYVFPVAGLAFGYPAAATQRISLRLPLSATVHQDRYSEHDVERRIQRYNARRSAFQPYTQQRSRERFGTSETYGWAEDKARQYALPERADFGTFIRSKGFRLE